MVFSFLRGEFIDVIEWTDDSRDTMVWRFERHGNAIKYGAKLTVRASQVAVFVHEGQLADIFEPGLYQLETNNMPIMTTLQHWSHAFNSPFKSEIYFINTRRFTNLKWGTKNPVMLRDPEFGPTRLRAFGSYTIRITDPARFMTEIVGTDGHFTQDEIALQIRNIVVQKFSRAVAASGIPVLDMAANTRELSAIIAEAISPTLTEYGLEMPELYIENISLPEAVEKALDKRTSMGVVGDLDKYAKFATAEAMQAAATTEGGGMGSGLGAGLGMGMGMTMAGQMAQQPQSGAQPPAQPGAAPPPPPPPPAQTLWHIAENGQTRGPFGTDDLARMAAAGQITRDTLVWTEGQAGWEKAGALPALAHLFSAAPPPPPPAPG
ncbi:SPFH domain-containing protein [Alkalilacustris brevis]|uniref:SPFH domain-containing protein n=1 Tax=Alkalilacustris brevis TaxID=2026338 RepID=UPI000E0CF2A8|nr:SPFH domain-containing protein [Alkalilacustris brevis]